jgi:hypothetical protein
MFIKESRICFNLQSQVIVLGQMVWIEKNQNGHKHGWKEKIMVDNSGNFGFSCTWVYYSIFLFEERKFVRCSCGPDHIDLFTPHAERQNAHAEPSHLTNCFCSWAHNAKLVSLFLLPFMTQPPLWLSFRMPTTRLCIISHNSIWEKQEP